MPRKVLQKLESVTLKVAHRVSRARIGSLAARLYFTPVGGDEEEVPVSEFADLGVTSKNFRTGEEVQAHRYQAMVGKTWWKSTGQERGRYSVRLDGEPDSAAIPVDLEGTVANDADIMVKMEFREAIENVYR